MQDTNAEQLLDKCRKITMRVKLLEEQLAMQESMMERITSRPSLAPGGGQRHDLGDVVIRLEEMQSKMADAVCDSIAVIWAVNQLLQKLPEQQENVMRAYYILGLPTWRAVGKRTGYSESHCYEIRAAAVKRMQVLLDEGKVAIPDI